MKLSSLAAIILLAGCATEPPPPLTTEERLRLWQDEHEAVWGDTQILPASHNQSPDNKRRWGGLGGMP